jgi:hypothetical protein
MIELNDFGSMSLATEDKLRQQGQEFGDAHEHRQLLFAKHT